MAKRRIEYQEMVDLDGYRKAVADAKADYKDFVDNVTRLNKQMGDSILQSLNALEMIRKGNAMAGSNREMEEYAKVAMVTTQQLRDQRAASAALTTTNQQLDKAYFTLIERLEKVVAAYTANEGVTSRDIQLKKRQAAEIVSLDKQLNQLNKSVKANTDSVKEITGQYNLLEKELKEARSALKSLDGAFDPLTGKINRTNATAVVLANKITTADTALKKMAATMGQHQLKVGQYENALNGLVNGGFVGLIGSLGVVGIAFTKVIQIAGQAIDKMSQFEQIRAGLKAVTKDTNDLGSSQLFLEKTADSLGISVATLTDSYKGIKVGTRDTALEGKEADRIFKAFTTRLAELKAPADKSYSALKALSDMLSRGNITADDLKDQLGQAIPGATKLFADALGVSTVKLQDMMQKGELLAIDVLPKVATQLEKTFSGTAAENVESLVGATARLDNQTGLLLDTFNQTFGITRFFASIKNGIADTLSNMRAAMQSKDWAAFFLSLNPKTWTLAQYRIDVDSSYKKAIDDFISMPENMRKARLDILKDLAANAKNVGETLAGTAPERAQALTDYKKYTEQLTILTREHIKQTAKDREQGRIDERESDKKYHEGRIEAIRKQAQELSLAERNALISRYQGQISQDQSTIQKRPDLVNSLTRDINYAKEFIKAIQDVNKELEKKDKKDAERDAKAAKRAASVAANRAKQEAEQQLRNSLGVVSASTGEQLGDLTSKHEQDLVTDQQYIMARYNITVSGINKRRALLIAAGKQETDDYANLNKELAKADADYQKGRADIQEKAFKKVFDAAKKAIVGDENTIKTNLKNRLADLETAFEAEQGRVRAAVTKRQITQEEGAQRIRDLELRYLDDIVNATVAASDTQQQAIARRIDELKKQGKTQAQIEQILQLEIEETRKATEEADVARDKRRVDRAKKLAKDEEDIEREHQDRIQKIQNAALDNLSTAVSSYFDVRAAFLQQDLDNLEKQKQYELDLAGSNDEQKKAIESKYAQRQKQIRRKQAEDEKLAAIFSIAISTAKAVAEALPNLVLAALAGSLGLIQGIAVAAKPLPEFWKGTQDAPEGPAWVGERGYELIESQKGGKPYYRLAAEKQIMYLNRHDRVMTHQETKQFLRVNTELAQDVRSAPGGSMYSPVVQAGPSEESMERAMRNALAGLPVEENHWDELGYRRAQRKADQHRAWVKNHFSLPKN
ncbi:tape measure protein [Spirosoma aerolatum]|uniref:tape measure protein n=1 Tax=Spirosoma aerolatum TaxID=1211326 RepID=UPI0009AE1D77|nr:tape measure protein [Spirosoma aerolatum]